jgi:20S proteasome subunit alpha 3
MEAINKAGPAIGLLTLDGLIIVCEKQNVTALLKQSTIISIGKTSEKIYAIDRHIFCVVSGIASDANYLIDYAR